VSSRSAIPVTSLPKGHAFARVRFTIDRAQAAAYLEATGDTTDYGDALPPLAVVALALGALQEQIALPEGALHTGQEVEHRMPATAGEALELRGQVAMRSERQGFVITALDYTVSGVHGDVVTARTTIMAPAPGGGA